MPDRNERRITRGRRETDGIIDERIDNLHEAFARLERMVGPVAGDLGKLIGTLEALEKWLEDERTARRHHDGELDDRIDELRDHFQRELRELVKNFRADLKALEGHVDEEFGRTGTAITSIGADQRSGRRTLLVTLISTAGLIIVAVITHGAS